MPAVHTFPNSEGTGVADTQRTYIYKDGILRRCDQYTGVGDSKCQNYDSSKWVTPAAGNAPVRIGTRDLLKSFFWGGIPEVRFSNRVLTDSEIAAVAGGSNVPQDGLVAEFLLNQDIARDTTGTDNANVIAGVWKAS
jgi:hypothetical protein